MVMQLERNRSRRAIARELFGKRETFSTDAIVKLKTNESFVIEISCVLRARGEYIGVSVKLNPPSGLTVC